MRESRIESIREIKRVLDEGSNKITWEVAYRIFRMRRRNWGQIGNHGWMKGWVTWRMERVRFSLRRGRLLGDI